MGICKLKIFYTTNCNNIDTFSMLGWALAEERRKILLQKPKVDSNTLLDKLKSQIHGGIATKK